MLHILTFIVLWAHGTYAKSRSTTSTAYTGLIQTASSTDVEIKLPTVLPKKNGKLDSIYSLEYLLTSLRIRHSNSSGNSRYVSDMRDSCSMTYSIFHRTQIHRFTLSCHYRSSRRACRHFPHLCQMSSSKGCSSSSTLRMRGLQIF